MECYTWVQLANEISEMNCVLCSTCRSDIKNYFNFCARIVLGRGNVKKERKVGGGEGDHEMNQRKKHRSTSSDASKQTQVQYKFYGNICIDISIVKTTRRKHRNSCTKCVACDGSLEARKKRDGAAPSGRVSGWATRRRECKGKWCRSDDDTRRE